MHVARLCLIDRQRQELAVVGKTTAILHGRDFRPWNFKLEMSGCGQWGDSIAMHLAMHARYGMRIPKLKGIYIVQKPQSFMCIPPLISRCPGITGLVVWAHHAVHCNL